MRKQFKTLVYLTCCIAEDEVNQKRGVVGLFYFNRNIPTAKRVLQRNAQLSAWLPIRFVAGHLCYDDPRLRIFNAILMLAIGRERRVRLRMHEGTIGKIKQDSPLCCLVATSDTCSLPILES